MIIKVKDQYGNIYCMEKIESIQKIPTKVFGNSNGGICRPIYNFQLVDTETPLNYSKKDNNYTPCDHTDKRIFTIIE